MALSIIGAGLGRTGTLSLKLALEHLGLGPCYHMTEVMANGRRALPLWLEAVRGRPDWDAVFAGFAATTDYPACSFWRELAGYYPEAKVILTTRDADDWFDSVSRTIFSPEHRAGFEGGETNPLAEFFTGTVFAPFGDRTGDRAFMTAWFRAWEADVIATLPPGRLLVQRPGDGWEPLCAFLGVPVPMAPYPRVNSSDDMIAAAAERPSEPPPPEIMERHMRGYLEGMREKAFGIG